jgi:hypothetical protein
MRELGRHSGEKHEGHRGSHGRGSGAASTGEWRGVEEKNKKKKGEAAQRVRLPRLEVVRRSQAVAAVREVMHTWCFQ